MNRQPRRLPFLALPHVLSASIILSLAAVAHAQTYQIVETGNADIGFGALAQGICRGGGSRWIGPDRFYIAIAQDAVLLKRGADNEAARTFLAVLKGPEMRAE